MTDFTTRPELSGTFGAVASTHWIASAVGMRMLEAGGNAFDAAVAAGFTLQIVEPHLNGPGGDAPIIAARAGDAQPTVICGQGPSPSAATIDAFDKRGLEMIPGTGLLAACVPGAFDAWLTFSQTVPQFPTSQIVNGGAVRDLSEAERAAYDAPYPDESYKAGARAFPALVPVREGMASVQENIAAWAVLEKFEKPFLTAFSDSDAITKGGEKPFQTKVPGARAQEHVTIVGGGHFLQEDQPEQIADVIDAFIARTR